MKKCPICNKKITRAMLIERKKSLSPKDALLERIFDGKNVIRCPHCKSRLRKISIGFFVALLPFIISTIVYTLTHKYAFLIYLSVAIFIIVYINLPYSSCDTKN